MVSRSSGKRWFYLPALLVILLGVAVALSVTMPSAIASHTSLTGSDFEIDDDANLKVDHDSPPSIDWANVAYIKLDDEPSGSNDDSFTQGTKEDTAIPVLETGSIPPNKSDLKTFGIYQEEGDPGFLHLFWTRVQEPNGTTNMDFEFNQSSTASANGVTPVRTAGDLLIVYELSKGGTVPELYLFTWLDGSEGIACEASNSFPCWGDRSDLDAAGKAVGSINTSAIPDADSAGLGPLSARTFGEASIDLDVIFDANKCTSFGSAYLKSRSSDSFTSALKDFIAPEPVDISNCGKVIIRKQTEPDGAAGSFDFTTTVQTEPASGSSFSLSDDGVETVNNVLVGTGYTVTESGLATGYTLIGLDCAASDDGLVTSISGATVTFDMTADGTVDCTYTNQARGNIIVVKETDPDGSGQSFDFTASYDADGFSLMDGESNDSGELAPGTYSVSETVPSGWDLTSATCDDGSDPSSVNLGAGETVTCTFVNQQDANIVVVKQTDPDGSPQSFDFTASYDADGFSLTDGQSNDSGDLDPGTYGVGETVPSGWQLTSATCDDGSDPASIGLSAGETVTCTFVNQQDANIVVVKETNPPGATQSFDFTASYDADGFSLTDGQSNDSGDLDPGTYSVSETVPAGWTLSSATCTDGSEPASIELSAGETVTCTFVNSTAAIVIEKRSTKTGNPLVSNDGAVFSYNGSSVTDNGDGDEDPTVGVVCVSGLVPGDYTVNETTPPAGYGDSDQSDLVVTAAAGTDCGSNLPSGSGVVTFNNAPLYDLQVNFRDGGSGETSVTSITCVDLEPEDSTTPPSGWDTSKTYTGREAPDTVVCTIVVDP